MTKDISNQNNENNNYPNIISQGDVDYTALLWDAVAKGNTELTRELLANGAEVNIQDEHNQTPLHRAAAKGHTDIVELLLAHGAEVNIKDKDNQAPLYRAAEWGHTDIVKLLLAKGADVNIKSKNYKTPLHWAAEWGCTDVVKLLLANGAEVNAKTVLGNTPLYRAASSGHTDIVKLLLDNGDVSVDPLTLIHSRPGTIKLLCQNAVDVGDLKNQESLLKTTVSQEKKDYLIILLLLREIIGHETVDISTEQAQNVIQRVSARAEDKHFIEETFRHILMNNMKAVEGIVPDNDRIIAKIEGLFGMEIISNTQKDELTKILNNQDVLLNKLIAEKAEQIVDQFGYVVSKNIGKIQAYLNKQVISLKLNEAYKDLEGKYKKQVAGTVKDGLPGVIVDDEGNLNLSLKAHIILSHPKIVQGDNVIPELNNVIPELKELADALSKIPSLKHISSLQEFPDELTSVQDVPVLGNSNPAQEEGEV